MRFAKYFSLLGILLFFYIVYSIGPMQLLASIEKLNPLFFLLALLAVIPVVIVKAVKQNVLIKPFGATLPLLEGSKIWMIGFFLSIITPGKSGDFLRAVYISRETSVSNGLCLAAVAFERVFDLGYLFIAGILGLTVLSISFGMEASAIGLLGLLFVLFVAGVFVITKKNVTAFFARPLFNILTPERFKEKFKSSFHGFYDGFGIYRKNKKAIFYAIGLTVLSWLLIYIEYYFLALALNLQLSYWALLLVLPVIIIVEVLPVSISGIGTRDATTIFIFSLWGIGAAEAVSFSLSMLALSVLLAFVGLVFFQKKKISL